MKQLGVAAAVFIDLVTCRAVAALWRPEYASYMVEGTPGRPYGHRMAHFNMVEANMRLRFIMFHYKYALTVVIFISINCTAAVVEMYFGNGQLSVTIDISSITSVACFYAIDSLLWPPCIADADIIFLSCFYLSFFLFFPRLLSAVADWMSTILRHMVWSWCEFRMQV